MYRAWLRTATTILLSALYLLVGLTGESLHYLVASDAKSHKSSEEEASVGYYHCHGPDFHVHYHGPARSAKSEHASSPVVVTNKLVNKKKSDSGVSFRKPGRQHEPHACPLLAVVSVLKLSQGGLSSWSLEVSTCHRVDTAVQQLALRGCGQHNLARGPPSPAIV